MFNKGSLPDRFLLLLDCVTVRRIVCMGEYHLTAGPGGLCHQGHALLSR